jgi:16S rRNA (uracil1498-N3)-methyltransferase
VAHFYLDERMADVAVGDALTITGTEARHAVTVSRVSVGENLVVGDGAGRVVNGTVTSAAPTALELSVDSVTRAERPTPALVLVQALAKQDRDELAIQAATELGVDAVLPWAAARSVSRWEGAKVAKGVERWSAITREASKQAVRPWLPDVLDLATTKQLVRLAGELRILVLEPTATTALSDIRPDGRDIAIVVGPEGGIADHELAMLTDAGAELIRLGDTVLRTSTAGPAAIAVLNVALGRW